MRPRRRVKVPAAALRALRDALDGLEVAACTFPLLCRTAAADRVFAYHTCPRCAGVVVARRFLAKAGAL